MQTAYVSDGQLLDGHTVALDDAVPFPQARVRVTLELLDDSAENSTAEVLAKIWEGQRLRGHRPPTPAEVARDLAEERGSWDE